MMIPHRMLVQNFKCPVFSITPVLMEAPPSGFSIMSDGSVMMGDMSNTRLSPTMLALMAAVTAVTAKKKENGEWPESEGEDNNTSSDERESNDEGDKNTAKGSTEVSVPETKKQETTTQEKKKKKLRRRAAKRAFTKRSEHQIFECQLNLIQDF